MNRVKVYNSRGELVDTFNKPQKKSAYYPPNPIKQRAHPTMGYCVRYLNSKGYYISRQLHDLKIAVRVHTLSKPAAILRGVFK